MTTNTSNRYSDADLLEFTAAINKDLAKSKKQLANLEEQLADAVEANDDQGDYVDSSANQSDLDLIQTMANRQRKHILDLQNALQRVHNKSYGICIVTGELIDKRRLLAVPTTARSLAAKVTPPVVQKQFKPAVKAATGRPNKIISRVISKPKPASIPITKDWDEDDEYYDEEGLFIEDEFDFDSIPDEDIAD